MAYNQALAQRIRAVLGERSWFVEKKMFGGVGFLLNGNMAVGVLGNDLIVRIKTEDYQAALSKPFAKPFMGNRGKPMAGWVTVPVEGLESSESLQQWIEQGYQLAQSLPPKR